MIVVILAGGKGTRISEETKFIPKPLIKIGSYPIIWHIIKYYKGYGYKKFIILGGYKFNKIKKFFLKKEIKGIEIKIINTGLNTTNGGRIYKVKNILSKARFMLTYGDGLSNVNLNLLKKFHLKNKNISTVTAVRPPARWGYLHFKNHKIYRFDEKKISNEGWINGGFFIFEPETLKFFKKNTVIETNLIPKLVKLNLIKAYKHKGFWQCMDNMRDKEILNKMWKNHPKWKIWQ
jgi:glucose-1-phosphate cytidylyltransferase